MKKMLSKIILAVIAVLFIIFLIIQFYIKPLNEIENLNKWYEYLLAIGVLTIIYILVFFLVKYILKLLFWAIDIIESKNDEI